MSSVTESHLVATRCQLGSEPKVLAGLDAGLDAGLGFASSSRVGLRVWLRLGLRWVQTLGEGPISDRVRLFLVAGDGEPKTETHNGQPSAANECF